MNDPNLTLAAPTSTTAGDRIRSPAAAGEEAAVAVVVDDPSRQSHPAEPGRPEGRRSSGVVRIGHLDHDSAVFRDRAAGGPHCGEAACRSGFSCDQLPVRPTDRGKDEGLAAAGWRAVVSFAREGRTGSGFFHRLGRAWRRNDHVLGVDGRLCAAARAWPRRVTGRAAYCDCG